MPKSSSCPAGLLLSLAWKPVKHRHRIYSSNFILIPVLQDTVVILPPCPFTLQDPSDIPIAECWYARPDAPSCSSLAMCDPRTAGHQVWPTTPMAPITSGMSWFSSAPLNRWIYPRTAQWSKLECQNFMSLPPRPSSGSLWLPASRETLNLKLTVNHCCQCASLCQ